MCSGHFKSISISFSFVCLHSVFHCIRFHVSIWSARKSMEHSYLGVYGFDSSCVSLKPTELSWRAHLHESHIHKKADPLWVRRVNIYICSMVIYFHMAKYSFLTSRLVLHDMPMLQMLFCCPAASPRGLPGRWQIKIRDSHTLIERHAATSQFCCSLACVFPKIFLLALFFNGRWWGWSHIEIYQF